MSNYTKHPLTYLVHPRDDDKIGEDWHICLLDFGLDGQLSITTDHVHASECVFGEPEADVRLWCAAPALLKALQSVAYIVERRERPPSETYALLLDIARAAIAKAEASNDPR